MFDIAPTEFLAVAVVALVVIGPKDLPKAMRVLGYWVGKARGAARQFRSGFDSMVREAELAEMEKRWAAENERIMREHGAGAMAETGLPTSAHDAAPALSGATGGAECAAGEAGTAASDGAAAPRPDEEPDLFSRPATVEHPLVEPTAAPPSADAKASS